MRSRPRRGALGLRGRIVATVLITTVATLGVAAVALLGPLEHSLRKAAQNTLKKDLGRNPQQHLAKLDLSEIALAGLDPDPSAKVPPPALKTLGREFEALVLDGVEARRSAGQDVAQLAAQIGGTVYVLGYPDVNGNARPPIASSAAPGPFDDAAKAFLTHHSNSSFGTIDGKEYARNARLFTDSRHVTYVLAVRKPIDEIPGAVRAVRTAFIYAAAAGLALTLLLAIPLAATLVRRLRRLRESALEIAREGLPVEVAEDRARDEVGDLARTFVIMQQRLRQQEEARRAFVATASHELRTPLTSLDGMLELLDDDLQSGDPDLDDARLLVDRARAQSRRLGRLAADLLDLSRIDAEVKLRSEPVELGELCRAVLAEFEHALGTRGRGISSALEDSAGPIWALGDPGSVARILRILLDNAVRVSTPGSEVTVELHGEPRPSLSVRDRGPGVEPSERDLIFERFHRGRATAGDAGFGLGLAIGRELAERMSGELVLEPANGLGATFTLILPATRAPEEDPAVAV
jgi:signal transduction histidine kinase